MLITCRVVTAAAAICVFRQLKQLVVKSIIITQWKAFSTNDFTQQSYIRGVGVINIALLSIERKKWIWMKLQWEIKRQNEGDLFEKE